MDVLTLEETDARWHLFGKERKEYRRKDLGMPRKKGGGVYYFAPGFSMSGRNLEIWPLTPARHKGQIDGQWFFPVIFCGFRDADDEGIWLVWRDLIQPSDPEGQQKNIDVLRLRGKNGRK